MFVRPLPIAVLALLVTLGSTQADALLLNGATGYALVPGDADPSGVRRPTMLGIKDKEDQPRHRWVFVRAGDGFLIRNADSGLTLVPVFETRKERHGKLRLMKVKGEGQEYQRWRFVKTQHGYLVQNVETGMSLVPIREEAGTNGGKLVVFRVEDEMNEGGTSDQNWKILNFEPGR